MWPLVEERHKSLISLMGKPLIQWTIESLQRAGVTKVIVVQGPERHVERALSAADFELKLHFVQQPKSKGMGDALLQTESLLNDHFFLLHPYRFDAGNFVSKLFDKAKDTNATAVLSAQQTEQPWNYGILTVDGDRVLDLVEKPKENYPGNLRVLGVYYLPKTILDDYRAVPETEYAFEDALGRCIERGEVRSVQIERAVTPLKHPWDLLDLSKALLQQQVTETSIDPSAHIDETAVIKGPVFIGPNVKIFEHAVVKGPCYLGAGCVVGTGSLVREGVILEENVLIGAHAEVVRSVFGKGSTTHSGFFGDSVFCEGAKAGAGTVTANVRVDRKQIFSTVKGKRTPTGLTSFGAIVGAHTHIGINAMLMPGALIGSRCLVGPGALVRGVVSSGSRYFER